MTALKRMALAIGCMLLSIALVCMRSVVMISLRDGLRAALPDVEIMPAYLIFAIPGSVLALPFVLLFKNAEGWRAWAILFIGTAIGPFFICAWNSLAAGRIIVRQADGLSIAMSLLIGSLTVTFYVLLLRHSARLAA